MRDQRNDPGSSTSRPSPAISPSSSRATRALAPQDSDCNTKSSATVGSTLLTWGVNAWSGVAACGYVESGESGVVLSPGYFRGADYPPDAACDWELRAPPGHRIQLNFSHFDVQPATNCDKDWLRVRSTSHPGWS